MNPRERKLSQAGFTLVELAVVVMIVGILAGIAIPSLRFALLRAEGAQYVAEAEAIRLAATEALTENGSFPTGGGWGSPPAAMVPHLPDNFDFVHKSVQYMWFSITLPSYDNVLKSRHIGILILNLGPRPEMIDALRGYSGPHQYGSGQYYYFLHFG